MLPPIDLEGCIRNLKKGAEADDRHAYTQVATVSSIVNLLKLPERWTPGLSDFVGDNNNTLSPTEHTSQPESDVLDIVVPVNWRRNKDAEDHLLARAESHLYILERGRSIMTARPLIGGLDRVIRVHRTS